MTKPTTPTTTDPNTSLNAGIKKWDAFETALQYDSEIAWTEEQGNPSGRTLDERCVAFRMTDDVLVCRAEHQLTETPDAGAVRCRRGETDAGGTLIEQRTQIGTAYAWCMLHYQQPAACRAGGLRRAFRQRDSAIGAPDAR